MSVSPKIVNELIELAKKAKQNAHCPYSKFPVGAAIWFESGNTTIGCNVENSSFGATICAERVAMPAGVVAGYGKPLAIAVISKLETPIPPCGMCRQFLLEFNPELEIYCCSSNGEFKKHILKDILPIGFGSDSLENI